MTVRTLPPTSVGKAATELVNAINSGEIQQQRRFLESHISENGRRERALVDSLSLLQKAFRQSGGVEINQVERTEPNPFVFYVASKQGYHWTRIFLFMDKTEEDKIKEFGFLPIRDPLAANELPWPDKRSNDDQSKKEIERHVERAGWKDTFSGVVLIAEASAPMVDIATGYADKSFNVTNKPDTKFNIGSMNKMFTSLSVAQLIQKNKLSLDDKIGDILQDYPNSKATRSITTYHLLSHQAGLGGLFERPKYDNRHRYHTNQELLPIFADQPLLFEPGSKGMYSNEGYIVLGAMIEEVTGENYHDYVRESITDPVGMSNTRPFALDESTPNLAVGYMQKEDDPFGLEPRHPNHMVLGWRGNACGGGYSTAPDLLKFASALKNHKIVGKDLTDHFVNRQGKMRNYGLGFEVEDYNGRRVVGHTGGGPNSGVNCALKMFWDTDQTVIVLGNYDAPAAQDLASDITKFLST